ncbi:hypothetical protein I3843_15G047700 [Carya illinoinensis]|nr:hypothetical protein I3843_15G047700 [Carya illinoinensis]
MNGIRFHTQLRELRRRTQNSGVLVTSEHQSSMVDFYGVLNDILEVRYMGWRRVWLFSCDWFDVGDPIRGIRVASQVFYLKDTRFSGSWHIVQKITYRNVYDVPQLDRHDDVDEPSESNVFQEEQTPEEAVDVDTEHNVDNPQWVRPDVQSATIATTTLAGGSTHNVNNLGNIDDISDEEEFNSSDTMSNGSCEEEDLDDTDAESNVEGSPSNDTDRGWDSS